MWRGKKTGKNVKLPLWYVTLVYIGCDVSLVYLLSKTSIVWLANLLTMRVSDERYFGSMSCWLNLLSIFLLKYLSSLLTRFWWQIRIYMYWVLRNHDRKNNFGITLKVASWYVMSVFHRFLFMMSLEKKMIWTNSAFIYKLKIIIIYM